MFSFARGADFQAVYAGFYRRTFYQAFGLRVWSRDKPDIEFLMAFSHANAFG